MSLQQGAREKTKNLCSRFEPMVIILVLVYFLISARWIVLCLLLCHTDRTKKKIYILP